jgi:predicted molibdopterin-dependent oxidoreductase YjgC
MNNPTVNFTLDDETMSAFQGEIILQRAKLHGKEIPRLCYKEGLRQNFKLLALCEIQWVIKFKLTAKEINHVNEVIDITVASGSTFSQLNLTIDTFKNAVSNE